MGHNYAACTSVSTGDDDLGHPLADAGDRLEQFDCGTNERVGAPGHLPHAPLAEACGSRRQLGETREQFSEDQALCRSQAARQRTRQGGLFAFEGTACQLDYAFGVLLIRGERVQHQATGEAADIRGNLSAFDGGLFRSSLIPSSERSMASEWSQSRMNVCPCSLSRLRLQ